MLHDRVEALDTTAVPSTPIQSQDAGRNFTEGRLTWKPKSPPSGGLCDRIGLHRSSFALKATLRSEENHHGEAHQTQCRCAVRHGICRRYLTGVVDIQNMKGPVAGATIGKWRRSGRAGKVIITVVLESVGKIVGICEVAELGDRRTVRTNGEIQEEMTVPIAMVIAHGIRKSGARVVAVILFKHFQAGAIPNGDNRIESSCDPR